MYKRQVLTCLGTEEKPHHFGQCRIRLEGAPVQVDTDWFAGGWFDPLSMQWKAIREGSSRQAEDPEGGSIGASLSAAFTLHPGESRALALHFAWYVPYKMCIRDRH